MDIKRIAIIAAVILVVAIAAFAYISMNTTETKIDINANSTLQNGGYIYIQLKDNYRHEIPDQIVDLKILDDSGWAHKYNVTTDEVGRGYIQVAGLENGNYTIHANFNGTLFLKASHSSFSFKIDDGYSSYY